MKARQNFWLTSSGANKFELQNTDGLFCGVSEVLTAKQGSNQTEGDQSHGL